MILGKEVRKEVRRKEKFFNEFLETDEKEFVGKVYLEYSYKMNNIHREPDDRFRIILYPTNAPGKLVFYSDSLYLYSYLESIAEQFKEYCKALEGLDKSEGEYRKAWKEVVGMYSGPTLVKVDFSKEFIEEQSGNNILTILDEKDISIREMAIALNRDYSGVHRLVNRESLETTQLGTLLQIAEYLNVDIYDLYK